MTGTKARDVECPWCGALPGRWCESSSVWGPIGYHKERIKAAAAVTREANREARR